MAGLKHPQAANEVNFKLGMRDKLTIPIANPLKQRYNRDYESNPTVKSGAEENEALIVIQFLFSDRFFYCMNEYRFRGGDVHGVTHNIT